jgi:hypothetical protein
VNLFTWFSTGVEEEESPWTNPRKKGDRSRRREKDDKGVKNDKEKDDEVAPKGKMQCYLCSALGHSMVTCPKLVDAQKYVKSLEEDEKAVDAILKEW